MEEIDFGPFGLNRKIVMPARKIDQRIVAGKPTIILIDETHGHPSIGSSIDSARLMVEAGVADTFGAEHFCGTTTAGSLRAIGNDPTFVNGIRKACPKARVIGVDHEQHFQELSRLDDSIQNKRLDLVDPLHKQPGDDEKLAVFDAVAKKDIREHPLTLERSKHFLKTLLEHAGEAPVIVLNAGARHNDQIIEQLLGDEFSFLRIRPDGYPAS